jgi:thiosulfate dehydrogenase [quinone] large subunit
VRGAQAPERGAQAPERGAQAGSRSSSDVPGPSLREQFERASLPARALLPIRFFFGITFLYAGADKLVDPAFFDASNPASIVSQLAAFARVSPLAFLIKPMEPFAIPIGMLIALAELAIGLGAITGLAFRLAAAGGAAVSLLFWLTASWSTHPYYYGPDLPYAFGWLALAIAGTSDLWVPTVVRELGAPTTALRLSVRSMGGAGGLGGFRAPGYLDAEPSPYRRTMLQAGALGAIALVTASLAVPLRLLRGDDASAALADASTPPTPAGPTPATGRPTPTLAPGATAAPSTTAVPAFKPSGLTVASIAQVDARGAVRIVVPANAPSSLPAGDPGVIVKLKDGSYAAYDALCTHEGCRVGWDAADGVLLCPCHGAAFDPNDHAAVLQGPTNTPLLELPIVVDHAAGTITLRA